MTRSFDPWVGHEYRGEGFRGVRLLILGESHYAHAGEERSGLTQNVVRCFGLAEERRGPFFTRTAKLVLGFGSGECLSNEERRRFWHRVAFYNYVQAFPGEKPRQRPTLKMWRAARAPFLQTVDELDPQVLLVLGKELANHLPQVPASVEVCKVPHPSSRSFRYADWQPAVQRIINSVRP